MVRKDASSKGVPSTITSNPEKLKESEVPALLNTHNLFTDQCLPVIGAFLLLLCLPYITVQIICCTLWQAIDKHVLGMVGMCKFVGGFPVWERFTRHKGDGFIFPTLLVLVTVPILCFHEAFYAREHGFIIWRAFLFNLLRIGPMYTNFAFSCVFQSPAMFFISFCSNLHFSAHLKHSGTP